jgi:hypothetical protein
MARSSAKRLTQTRPPRSAESIRLGWFARIQRKGRAAAGPAAMLTIAAITCAAAAGCGHPAQGTGNAAAQHAAPAAAPAQGSLR